MKAWNKGKRFYKASEIFCKNSTISQSRLRVYYRDEDVMYVCTICGVSEWNGKKLTLELDHINGEQTDNRKENLRWLCPNCHSLTPTFKGKSINSGVEKVSRKDLIDAIKNSTNVRETLKKVGLAPRGNNYSRVYKIMSEELLQFPLSGYQKGTFCKDCGSRICYNALRCIKCSKFYKRKTTWPTKEELNKLIEDNTWVDIGKMYSVSDNAVRKWARHYKLI